MKTKTSRFRFTPFSLALLVLLFSLSAVSLLAQSGSLVIKSKDGVSQLTVPAGWGEVSNLNDSAVIQATHPGLGIYVLVISEDKVDFVKPPKLADYLKHGLESLTSTWANSKPTSATSITVNGAPGLIYELHGEFNNLRMVFLLAAIETAGHFHQIGIWTTESKFAARKAMMMGVIDSFHEQ